MMTLYGKNPKKILCACNEQPVKAEAITIELNGRCPVCNKQYQVRVDKPKVQLKQLDEHTEERGAA